MDWGGGWVELEKRRGRARLELAIQLQHSSVAYEPGSIKFVQGIS